MNDNKYYTPSIEEFHVGFRYEYNSKDFMSLLDGTAGQWKKENFHCGCGLDGESEMNDIYNLIDRKSIRIKVLDRDDIEELGWKYEGKHWYYRGDEYYSLQDPYENEVWYFLHVHDNYAYYTILEGSLGSYSLEGSPREFCGDVKNYNELKRIMKQTLRIDG